MLFCLTGNYTPKSLNAIMDNPAANRVAAATKLVEAAGGKMISMYSTVADGPGVMVIFDVPDPGSAAAISGITVATGALQNVQLKRLLSAEEVVSVRTKAAQLRGAYTPPAG